ncbi:transcriptional regulator, XRE family [Rhodovulum sp. PH10]|uniref:hypothetical protein n=1 Tax=Rhodovulum sp. PH10 TaxID=1187851 RepID=UPI00027C210C|nr:hypothetical protein [Rhodovulum sp. PH10]EJW09484.1 transcriptional regulator, XRE family [Rhodovulum sp. PH10]
MGDELDVLLALVDIYERKRRPIEIGGDFDPIDVLRYAIDELGHTQSSWRNSWDRAPGPRRFSHAGARSRSR